MPKFSLFYFKTEYSMYSLFGMGSKVGFSVDNLPTTHVELFSGVDAPSKEALFPTFQAGGSGWAGKTEEQNNAMLIEKGWTVLPQSSATPLKPAMPMAAPSGTATSGTPAAASGFAGLQFQQLDDSMAADLAAHMFGGRK
eukprot:7129-Heterococcus_DN1.PRE.2